MKVLILGGTGVTGSLVRKMLSNTKWQVDYCSRHKVDDSRHIKLNLSSPEFEIVRVLREYDWVVSCVGPFERWLDKIARICIASGTNYIDVNDSVDAREAILELPAKDAGVTIMTGAGLCPGLSTALLMGAIGEPVKRIRAVLRIGGGQAIGPSSVLSMFSTMYSGYRVLLNGSVQTISHSKMPDGLSGYECPDMGAVSSLFPEVQDYSYFIGFTELGERTIQALQTRRFFSLPYISRWLARRAATGVTNKALEKNEPQAASLEVAMETDTARTVVSLGGLTSYQFTALAAATCLQGIVAAQMPSGTFEVARVPALPKLLLDACREHGASISRTDELL